MELKHRSQRRSRVPISCIQCHRRKKKCNRVLPCNDCYRRGVPHECQYIKPTNANLYGVSQVARNTLSGRRAFTSPPGIPISEQSIFELSNTSSGPTTADEDFWNNNNEGYFPRHMDTFLIPGVNTNLSESLSLASTFAYPLHYVVGGQMQAFPTVTTGILSSQKIQVPGGLGQFVLFPNMPDAPMPPQLLIQYFILRLGPWLSYLDETLTPRSPRLGWLTFAIQHPPLWYATLLTAAVHLNHRKPMRDPSSLIFYKMQTIRCANEVMNRGTLEEKASDEMIIVALVLLYFDIHDAVGVEEHMVHLRGIEQMLSIRGGTGKLGMRGMPRNWLGVCHGPWSEGFQEGGFEGVN